MKNIYEGSEFDLRELAMDDPDRPEFEQKLVEKIMKDIDEVRSMVIDNLWLLTASLKDPEGKHGFHTWDRSLGIVIGTKRCAEIGQSVCSEKGFTLEECEKIQDKYRQLSAQELGLRKNATWEDINKAREKRMGSFRHL